MWRSKSQRHVPPRNAWRDVCADLALSHIDDTSRAVAAIHSGMLMARIIWVGAAVHQCALRHTFIEQTALPRKYRAKIAAAADRWDAIRACHSDCAVAGNLQPLPRTVPRQNEAIGWNPRAITRAAILRRPVLRKHADAAARTVHELDFRVPPDWPEAQASRCHGLLAATAAWNAHRREWPQNLNLDVQVCVAGHIHHYLKGLCRDLHLRVVDADCNPEIRFVWHCARCEHPIDSELGR